MEIILPGRDAVEYWEPVDCHCLRCGARAVWIDAGEKKSDEGPEHICTECHARFHLGSRLSACIHERKRLATALRQISGRPLREVDFIIYQEEHTVRSGGEWVAEIDYQGRQLQSIDPTYREAIDGLWRILHQMSSATERPSNTLKNCTQCAAAGAEVYLEDGLWWVRCPSCTERRGGKPDRDGAIGWWNSRPVEDNLKEEIEQIRKNLQ